MQKAFCYVLGALLVALSTAVASSTGRLPELVTTADAIVIGKIVGGENTNQIRELEFSIDRVIKGSLQPGAVIRAGFRARDRAGRALVGPVFETGLIFLKEVGANSFELLSAETGELGLRTAYLPVPENGRLAVEGSGSTLDTVYAELIAAVEARPNDEQYLRLIVPRLSPTDSPLLAAAFQRWSASPSNSLRMLAIGTLVRTGSSQAVIDLRAELRSSPTSMLAKSVATSLHGFRGTDSPALAALNEIASISAGAQEVQEAVASALQSIHNRETLPGLKALLDSPYPLVRQLAVGGFSAFALQMRIPRDDRDAVEALDEILNPGRRRKIPAPNAPFDNEETRRFAHFGPFQDPVEEARLIAFWKEWCERNSGLLRKP